MKMQNTDTRTLQQRVNRYLSGKSDDARHGEAEDRSASAVSELLQSAETNLKNQQARVERLKWELARLQALG